MANDDSDSVLTNDRLARESPVPSGRLARLARLGGMTGGVVGNMALGGARALGRGERPRARDLLLTPANAARIADQLARMRGAAMKVGQLVSMDAGDFLPPELAAIMARLRADADPMPPRQLRAVLDAAWGPRWIKRFAHFDVRPLAAASIGQVHRAQTRDGRDLAIKIQYPGVARSIDSDVTNVGALLRVSGLLPPGFDLAPLLAEARRQLHDEANYTLEGASLERFGALLADDPAFAVPARHGDLSTATVLAMDHMPGQAIDTLGDAPQDARDRAAAALITLTLRELFDLRLMQTDPNFANYRHDPKTGRIVLLDFGATRTIDEGLSTRYRRLLAAGMDGGRAGIERAALEIGFLDPSMNEAHRGALLEMMEIAFASLRHEGPFDFARSTMTARMNEIGRRLARDRSAAHVPPLETLYPQRKIGGIYLLAARLGARVDLRALLTPYL